MSRFKLGVESIISIISKSMNVSISCQYSIERGGTHFRLSDDREIFIRDEELYAEPDVYLVRRLIDFIMGDLKQFGINPIRLSDSPKGSRVSEINAELDILRGVVPTPLGYRIDPIRAKQLMTELRGLLNAKEE